MGNPNAENAADRMGGHLGAPIPEHKGIPAVHFEKLSCTACHSGRLPEENTARVRTARMHKLGLHGRHAMNKQLPHVITPVFAKMENGKIGPHNMIWPSYWGTRVAPSYWGTRVGETITPLDSQFVNDIASDHLNPSDEEGAPRFSDDQIIDYYSWLASECEFPIVVHEMPFLSGYNAKQINWPLTLLDKLADRVGVFY